MDSNVGLIASCIAIFSLILMGIFMRSAIRSRREVEQSNRELLEARDSETPEPATINSVTELRLESLLAPELGPAG